MPGSIVVVGVPTALGGHLGGMERTPAGLRSLGLIEALADRGHIVRDAGDLAIDPGFQPDPDPRAKNLDLICAFLPREAALIAAALADAGARPLILGGDCTAHAGAAAGLRRANRAARLAIAWLDAHGDFNTPDITPSGNVWGMPFAMLCGIGDARLVAACTGPSVDPPDAALIGGQVLDEQESRLLVRSGVAHFGSRMLATPAGLASLAAWASGLAEDGVDGLYIAIDMDVLSASGGWAVQMPEPDGLELNTAVRVVRTLAAGLPVVGLGITAINLDHGDARRTCDAATDLAVAALA